LIAEVECYDRAMNPIKAQRILVGLVLCTGVLALPAAVLAQTTTLNQGSSGSSLQGAGASLQKPISGVQGTNPQNLTPSTGLALNQVSRDLARSSLKLQPSQTSTTITKIPEDKKTPQALKLIVFMSITIGAGLILWRQSAKPQDNKQDET
jgi:hypothetical protein